ncbi:MAG TPA: hypothetical protein VGA61_13625, partial [Anaerolineae bacterium]
DFQQARAHTTWIDEEYTAWQAPQCELPPEILVAAALAEAQLANGRAGVAGGTGAAETAQADRADPYSPWAAGDGLRLGEENPAGAGTGSMVR